MISSLSDFLQKSQEILQEKMGIGRNDLEFLSTLWWSLHLRQLGHSQNSMELLGFEMKKLRNSLRIAAE